MILRGHSRLGRRGIVGSAGNLMRARLPGDEARLQQIAALPEVDGSAPYPRRANSPRALQIRRFAAHPGTDARVHYPDDGRSRRPVAASARGPGCGGGPLRPGHPSLLGQCVPRGVGGDSSRRFRGDHRAHRHRHTRSRHRRSRHGCGCATAIRRHPRAFLGYRRRVRSHRRHGYGTQHQSPGHCFESAEHLRRQLRVELRLVWARRTAPRVRGLVDR